MFQPKAYTNRQLLQLHADIIAELIEREVVRTKNPPIGDYTEWLVAQKLGLSLSRNSTAGYDATDATGGTRYQIKSRHVHPVNPSRQLSVIRNLGAQKFDYLIAVIFDHDFNVQLAVKIPHGVIAEYASYRAHDNGHVLHIRGPILADTRIEDLTPLFQPEA
jgi:hypothetical protein